MKVEARKNIFLLPSNILHHKLPLDQRATPGSTKQNFLELPFRFLLAEAGRNILVPGIIRRRRTKSYTVNPLKE